MDTKSEDTIVRQIEKNLSNNINENLFLSGRAYDNKTPVKSNVVIEAVNEENVTENTDTDYPLVSYEHMSNSPTISRAEYIRQAREACLRQLSSSQVYSSAYDVNYMDSEVQSTEEINNRKAKVVKLFHNDTEEEKPAEEVNTPQEIASYRSLIIRVVCAIVLFLGVFIIDKFDIKIGNVTHNMIEEYVTGNDTLKQLEDILVTWLK